MDQTLTPLAAGTYEIRVQVVWAPEDVRDYTLSIYSEKYIPIRNKRNNRTKQVGFHDPGFTP